MHTSKEVEIDFKTQQSLFNLSWDSLGAECVPFNFSGGLLLACCYCWRNLIYFLDFHLLILTLIITNSIFSFLALYCWFVTCEIFLLLAVLLVASMVFPSYNLSSTVSADHVAVRLVVWMFCSGYTLKPFGFPLL